MVLCLVGGIGNFDPDEGEVSFPWHDGSQPTSSGIEF
jgi:hypothetical protein